VLAFLTRWSNVFAISKASRPEHVEENAGAADLHVSQPEIVGLEAVFPRRPGLRALPVL
jgi:diketogulonate reductase-like aldo/keto reductase